MNIIGTLSNLRCQPACLPPGIFRGETANLIIGRVRTTGTRRQASTMTAFRVARQPPSKGDRSWQKPRTTRCRSRTKISLRKKPSWERFLDWVRTELVWYAGSFSFHLLGLSVLLLLPNFGGSDNPDDATVLVSKAEEVQNKESEQFEPIDSCVFESIQPPELKIIDPTPRPRGPKQPSGAVLQCRARSIRTKAAACRTVQETCSVAMGRWTLGPGPRLAGVGGAGTGSGAGTNAGTGGTGTGFVGIRRDRIKPGTGISIT